MHTFSKHSCNNSDSNCTTDTIANSFLAGILPHEGEPIIHMRLTHNFSFALFPFYSDAILKSILRTSDKVIKHYSAAWNSYGFFLCVLATNNNKLRTNLCCTCTLNIVQCLNTEHSIKWLEYEVKLEGMKGHLFVRNNAMNQLECRKHCDYTVTNYCHIKTLDDSLVGQHVVR